MSVRVLGAISIILAMLIGGVSPAAAAAMQVWFSPDNDTPDLLDMFRNPHAWDKARAQISVIKFGPQQVGDNSATHKNTYEAMAGLNAFSLLQSWGIKVAIEVPAIKEWDCTGQQTVAHTVRLADNVQKAGGGVPILSIDEPLVSALRACHDTVEGAAAKTAAYIKQVTQRVPGADVVEGEPYPSYSVDQLEHWLTLLIAAGARPAAFHLDVNVHYLDYHPAIDVAGDLRRLRDWLSALHMPFGVIFWSGYDPEPTDQAYYERTMAWVRQVHAAIGAPDQAIFQSWVFRSAPRCKDIDAACNPPRLVCAPADPAGCGEKSVPVNLPENNPTIFSHTRLINDGIGVLTQPVK